MKLTVTTILYLIIVASMAGGAAAQSAETKPAAPTGLGFNVHITGPDQDWDAIKAAGVKLIRKDFVWTVP